MPVNRMSWLFYFILTLICYGFNRKSGGFLLEKAVSCAFFPVTFFTFPVSKAPDNSP
jgi:hypothetical protein